MRPSEPQARALAVKADGFSPGAEAPDRAVAWRCQPGPRMRFSRHDRLGARPESRDGCKGHCHRTILQNGNRIAEVEFNCGGAGQLCERLDKEDESLRAQLQAGKQSFVKDEHRWEIWSSSESRIANA